MHDLAAYLKLVGDRFPLTLEKFLLDHGRVYATDKCTYAGRRGTIKQCFRNATHAVLEDNGLVYVEGYVTVHGVPVHHAWTVDGDGKVRDPTLRRDRDGTYTHVGEYYGVAFDHEYLMACLLENKVYGLLDVPYESWRALIDGRSKNFKHEENHRCSTTSLRMIGADSSSS